MVNIDADGQFDPQDIPKLLLPVMKARLIWLLPAASEKKKPKHSMDQGFSQQVRRQYYWIFLGYKTDDLTCGFRAHSREQCWDWIWSIPATYTQETIIDAIGKNLKLQWVPGNCHLLSDRKAKMTKSIYSFISNSFKIILRAIEMSAHWNFFGWPGLFLIILGALGFLIFFINYIQGFTSLPFSITIIFSAISMLFGIQLVVFALIADMIKTNRQLTEEMFYQWKKDKYDKR